MQSIVTEIRTYEEYIKCLNMKIQQAPADKAQAYLGSVEKIVLEFDQLVHHSEVQKKQLALVYEEVIVEFEEWINETVERLESGGIVTIDIEEFQGELTVSNTFPCTRPILITKLSKFELQQTLPVKYPQTVCSLSLGDKLWLF